MLSLMCFVQFKSYSWCCFFFVIYSYKKFIYFFFFIDVNMNGLLYVVFCIFFINSCIYVVIIGKERFKLYDDLILLEKEYIVDGEYNLEYDYEVFLGDMKDEYDEFLLEEVFRWLRVLVKKVDFDKDGFVIEEELINWVMDVFSKCFLEGIDEDVKGKDMNSDGKIIWDEYMKEIYGLEEFEDDVDEEIKQLLDIDKRWFDIVDKDKDGVFFKDEFVYFMYFELFLEMGDVYILEIIEGKLKSV